MVSRFKGFFKNNYWERAEITKIEVFLFIGLFVIFLPFVLDDLDDRFDRQFGSFESTIKEDNNFHA